MGDISDFYVGTDKRFTVTCKIAGVAQDITLDTVTVRLKSSKSDADASAVLSVNADVATQGASGVAIFDWDGDGTDITPGKYYLDIEWVLASGKEYIVYNDTIKALERVSDV